MSLIRKVAITTTVCGAFLAAVYCYYFLVWADYYFPGRYESAFAAFGNSVVVSIVVLAAVVVSHFIGRLRRRRSSSGNNPHTDVNGGQV